MKNNYSGWKIIIPDKTTGTLQEKVAAVLRFGILAPSTHNSQPWLFDTNRANSVLLKFNTSNLLPAADPTNKDAYVSLGCLVENIELAAKFLGLAITIKRHFDSDISGSHLTLSFKEAVFSNLSPEEIDLFHAITKRWNARLFFDANKKIPAEVIGRLGSFAIENPNVTSNIIENEQDIAYLAFETGAAVEMAQSRKDFRLEFSRIVRNNFTSASTGMPAFSFGIPNVFSLFIPFIFKRFDVSKPLRRVNEKAMLASSAVVVLSSKVNDQNSWFECGKILERQLLFLTSKSVASSIHVAMAEIPEFSEKLKKRIGSSDTPLMVYRIGYSDKSPRHTPRKLLEQCLISSHSKN
ncbi:MAG: hypothetical protein AAB402_04415 [Patescibacteria group bacterium]